LRGSVYVVRWRGNFPENGKKLEHLKGQKEKKKGNFVESFRNFFVLIYRNFESKRRRRDFFLKISGIFFSVFEGKSCDGNLTTLGSAKSQLGGYK